jgi:hypothetical protein
MERGLTSAAGGNGKGRVKGKEIKRKIIGHKKVQIPLACPPEVPYIRRPFSRSRD